jgi:hypothetical protein
VSIIHVFRDTVLLEFRKFCQNQKVELKKLDGTFDEH